MVEIHNGILATCTRNAQFKKQETKQYRSLPSVTTTTTAQTTARLSLQERLAAVTKGKRSTPTPEVSSSEVTLNQSPVTETTKEEQIDFSVLIQQAFDCVETLETGVTPNDQNFITHCKNIQSEICYRIPAITDQSQLGKLHKFDYYYYFLLLTVFGMMIEILLAVNDKLTSGIHNYETITTIETIDNKNEETLLSSSFEIGDDDEDDEDDDDEEDEEDEEQVRDDHLLELRNEIEAEECAAFLKAKQIESDVTTQIKNDETTIAV